MITVICMEQIAFKINQMTIDNAIYSLCKKNNPFIINMNIPPKMSQTIIL